MNSDGGSNNGRSPPPPPPPPFCCKCKCHNSRVASFPPGYKFNPTDEELVVDYLKKKVMNEPLPYKETMRTKIVEVNLYSHNPEDLAEQYNTGSGEKEWYFFTPRERKYRNGNRPNRAAGDGYWKATGADKEINSSDDGVLVGYRKALVFYKGKPSMGDKTSWIMHEFRFNAPARKGLFLHDMTLDDWVLCRIYKKIDSNKPKSKKEEEATQTDATGKQLEEAAASDENQIHEGGIDDDHDQEVTAPVDTVERYMSKDQEQPRQPALPTNPYGMCQTPPVPPFQDGSKANYQFIHGAQDQHYNISGNEIKYGFQQQQPPPPPPPPMMVLRPSMFPQMGPNSNLMFRAEQLIPQYAIDSKPGGLVVPKQYPQQQQQQQQQPQQYHDENEDMDSLQIQVYLEDVENLYLEALDRFNSYFPKDNNDKSPDGAHGPSFNQEFGS